MTRGSQSHRYLGDNILGRGNRKCKGLKVENNFEEFIEQKEDQCGWRVGGKRESSAR